MRETFPIKLLLRVLQATPEEQVAIERIFPGHDLLEPLQEAPRSLPKQVATGRKCYGSGEVLASLARIEGKVDAVRKAQRASGAVEPHDDLDDEELRKIYARVLLTSARRPGGREAPLKEVFDRYCLDGLSAKKVGEALGCSKSTVMNRLAALKKIAGVPAAKLRTYKPFFERTEESLRDPRARRGCRKQAAYGGETRAAE
jgi:hypothetical protein